MLSKSYIAVLSDEDRVKLMAVLREIVQRGVGKFWVDEAKGIFWYPYQTDLVIVVFSRVWEHALTKNTPGDNEEALTELVKQGH